MGARPLARVIQDVIKKPLANEILFGKLKKGGVVNVTVGPKEDGTKGIILEAISDTAPIKPKPEAEVVHPEVHDEDDGELKTKAKAKKATAKKAKAAVAEPEVKSAPKKSGAVPRVPKK
jgi:ATP-dependent Clp protease ATP-binding subunit ClpA